HLRRIDIQGARVDVHKDRPCATANDSAGGCEKTERSSDDLVARMNSDAHQREPNGIGSRRTANGGGRSGELSQRLFESFDLVTQNEVLRSAHALNRRQYLLPQGSILATEIEQGD